LLAFAAALFGSVLGFAALVRRVHSVASWSFFAGMQTLAIESVLDGISLNAAPDKLVELQTLASLARCFLPGWWLLFGLTYSRGNYREFLARWRVPLALAFLPPVAAIVAVRTGLIYLALDEKDGQPLRLRFGGGANAISIFLLVAAVLMLLHLEKTFRSAVGTLRWRIKLPVLGLAIIFGARIYVESQRLVYSGYSPLLADLETGGLLIGCTLIAIGYVRNGVAEVDVYPSRTVLQSSFTLLLAGGYFFVVGVLAQLVAHLGGAGSFQTQTFLILLGTAGLALLLFSDRFRQRLQQFVSRHFDRPQHDFRNIWRLMAHAMSSVLDEATLCRMVARLISETFHSLSVTIWLIDEQSGRLTLGASTSHSHADLLGVDPGSVLRSPVVKQIRELKLPFDLEKIREDWAESLRKMHLPQFRKAGNRICIPFLAADRLLGLAVLADRVDGAPYTPEELDLLECIGNQAAAGLLNLRLSEELVVAKQFEAVQTMSAFFVHDLKNVVSGLSLTLDNLRVHFDDPLFRQDALRGISATVNRINHLIGRVSVLRNKIDVKPVESDLNQLVVETLEQQSWGPDIELIKSLRPLPNILADPERLQKVVTNLLLNAREAVGKGGQVRVQTGQRDGHAVLTVADNGCGMSPAFLKDSLYRPFHTTKKEGLGIGLFQSRMIVEAHRGSIQVESEPGKGTTFLVILPLPREQSSVGDLEAAGNGVEPRTAELRTPGTARGVLRNPSPELRTPNAELWTLNSEHETQITHCGR
jgi:putative PEP-CTERM system histidine kinase